MENRLKQKQNRIWILINYGSLFAIMIFFYIGKPMQWPLYIILLEFGLLVVFAITFLRAFIKTGFWNFVHRSYKKLDEREKQVILNSLKYSYSVFTILTLVIIYSFAIVKQGPIDVLIAGGLLYAAHTIPAAIVGWNERIIVGSE